MTDGVAKHCSVCSSEFQVRFSYQMEEAQSNGTTLFRFYCSQTCLDRSHRGEAEDGAICDHCATSFIPEFAAQVFFVDGKRRYACSQDCRRHLKKEQLSLSEASAGHISHQAPPPSEQFYDAASATASKKNEQPLAARIAFFNHKGGTGKTTSTVAIATGLASLGKKVLLIDTDSQGNVAVSLGIDSTRSLYHCLVMGAPAESVVQSARPGLDVIAANETLAAAELYLAGRKQRDRVLQERIQPLMDRYDFILIDCSPSLSLLNQNALVLSEAVICPVSCDYLSLIGVRQVLKTLKNVNRHLAHPVQLYGVLPTMFDARANICQEALKTMKKHFGERCLKPIRNAMKVKEAPSQGQSITEYAPQHGASEDYQDLVQRLISDFSFETSSINSPSQVQSA